MELCPRWASPSPWARTACPCARSGAKVRTRKGHVARQPDRERIASLSDVRGTLTPQLNATEADTTLVLIDLGKGQNRMGGSILGQTHQSGDVVPDGRPEKTWCLVNAVNALRAKGQILAYHDRSDGGLLAAAAKWPLRAMWAWR